MADGRAHLDALAQHATGMQASVESLATQAGETPAQSLAQHAAQIEQELVHALEEARDFVRNEVVHGIEEVAHEIQDRCHAVHNTLAEEYSHALQAAFDEWESKVDELEDYVNKEGFLASHDHANACVDYSLDTCQAAYEEKLDGLRQVMDALGAGLQELGAEAQRSGDAAVAQTGADLTGRLSDTHEAAATALSALGSVRELLASYRFVQM
jgi:ABC-type transporter Mla subunit MlaD